MKNKLKELEKNTLSNVQKKVQSLRADRELEFPPNYSPVNALKTAWLTISQKELNGKPVLEQVTKTSVVNALLDTVLQGVTPARDQVYYIPRYNKKKGSYELHAQRSYFGDVAVAKRVSEVKDVDVNIIFEDDDIEMEKRGGNLVVKDHKTKFENRDKNIRGGYAVIHFDDDRAPKYEVMTMKEIKNSWEQSDMIKKNNDKDTIHDDFPTQMIKRTLTRRAVKTYINSADDAFLNAGDTPEIREEVETEAEKQKMIDEQGEAGVIDARATEPGNESEENESADETPGEEGGGEKQGEKPADGANDDGESSQKELPMGDDETELEKQQSGEEPENDGGAPY